MGSDEYFHMIDQRLVDVAKEGLQGLKVEDLESLYKSVSEELTKRNGYVADYNILLAALMGCNTNSLFLGSREQSQSALFYIGEITCTLDK